MVSWLSVRLRVGRTFYGKDYFPSLQGVRGNKSRKGCGCRGRAVKGTGVINIGTKEQSLDNAFSTLAVSDTELQLLA